MPPVRIMAATAKKSNGPDLRLTETEQNLLVAEIDEDAGYL